MAGRIVPTLFERVDDPIYPPEALREALANAFRHRHYALFGGSVSVGIFDDRLEIASPGGLHFSLTPDDLRRPHVSRAWNPFIARVLYQRGVIEQWGRGTLKMGELTERAGLAPPEFEERTGDLVVRFRPTQYVAPTGWSTTCRRSSARCWGSSDVLAGASRSATSTANSNGRLPSERSRIRSGHCARWASSRPRGEDPAPAGGSWRTAPAYRPQHESPEPNPPEPHRSPVSFRASPCLSVLFRASLHCPAPLADRVALPS